MVHKFCDIVVPRAYRFLSLHLRLEHLVDCCIFHCKCAGRHTHTSFLQCAGIPYFHLVSVAPSTPDCIHSTCATTLSFSARATSHTAPARARLPDLLCSGAAVPTNGVRRHKTPSKKSLSHSPPQAARVAISLKNCPRSTRRRGTSPSRSRGVRRHLCKSPPRDGVPPR